jgi:preprotein translocase subunit SecG
MYSSLIILQGILAFAIIVLILLQQGKGAGLGASFGSGAGGAMFGPIGTSNLLSRATAVMVACFFTVSMLIAVTGREAADISSQFSEEVLGTELQGFGDDADLLGDDLEDEDGMSGDEDDDLLPPLE